MKAGRKKDGREIFPPLFFRFVLLFSSSKLRRESKEAETYLAPEGAGASTSSWRHTHERERQKRDARKERGKREIVLLFLTGEAPRFLFDALLLLFLSLDLSLLDELCFSRSSSSLHISFPPISTALPDLPPPTPAPQDGQCHRVHRGEGPGRQGP